MRFLSGVIIASLAFFIGATARYLFLEPEKTFPTVFQGKIMTIIGTLADEPQLKGSITKIVINSKEIEGGGKVEGKLFVTLSSYQPLKRGMEMSVTGKIEPGMIMNFPDIKILKVLQNRTFFDLLGNLKTNVQTKLFQLFPTEPSSSLLSGLLMGDKENLPKKTKEAFQQTGLSHILVISGYNITLIIAFLGILLRPLGKKLSFTLTILMILFFTVFVGASAPVVRAAIMGSIGLLALQSNRQQDLFLTLLITASLMVGFRPEILVSDIGFQLSFMATTGIIYLSPLLTPRLLFIPKAWFLRESIIMTLAAEIMTFPFILFYFDRFPLLAPLSNVLIAGPLIPSIMLIAFLSFLISFIFFPLAKLLAFFAFLLLQYLLLIAETGDALPFTSFSIGGSSKLFLFFSLIALFSFISITYRNLKSCQQRLQKKIVQVHQQMAMLLDPVKLER